MESFWKGSTQLKIQTQFSRLPTQKFWLKTSCITPKHDTWHITLETGHCILNTKFFLLYMLYVWCWRGRTRTGRVILPRTNHASAHCKDASSVHVWNFTGECKQLFGEYGPSAHSFAVPFSLSLFLRSCVVFLLSYFILEAHVCWWSWMTVSRCKGWNTISQAMRRHKKKNEGRTNECWMCFQSIPILTTRRWRTNSCGCQHHASSEKNAVNSAGSVSNEIWLEQHFRSYHALTSSLENGSAAWRHDIGVQLLTDVNVTLHEAAEGKKCGGIRWLLHRMMFLSGSSQVFSLSVDLSSMSSSTPMQHGSSPISRAFSLSAEAVNEYRRITTSQTKDCVMPSVTFVDGH